MSFNSFGLDAVLVQAAKRSGFNFPTKIQSECIPAVLKGLDVVALSKTGTGKTIAYALPILHKLISEGEKRLNQLSALIIVPTKELVVQISEVFKGLADLAELTIVVSTLAKASIAREDVGHILICTPGQIAAKELDWFENMKIVVIDEADLILSYGYDSDMKKIGPKLPRSCQCILMSATKSSDLETVMKLVMETPHRINLLRKEKPITTGFISHQYIECKRDEKEIHLLVLLRFGGIAQPVVVFVNNIKEGYRLRLFLDCFRISAGIIHRELPVKARQETIEKFNRKSCRILIMVDNAQEQFEKTKKKTKSRHEESKEVEFSIARGLDLKNVKAVVNVQLPNSINGYIHSVQRAGRTGRAGNSGLCLSLTTDKEESFMNEVREYLNNMMDSGEDQLRPFLGFSSQQVEALKYRSLDVLKSISRSAINEARNQDLRNQMLRSVELEDFFEKHPEDKKLLEQKQTKNLKRSFERVNRLPNYIAEPTQLTKQAPKRFKVDPLTKKKSKRRKR